MINSKKQYDSKATFKEIYATVKICVTFTH